MPWFGGRRRPSSVGGRWPKWSLLLIVEEGSTRGVRTYVPVQRRTDGWMCVSMYIHMYIYVYLCV